MNDRERPLSFTERLIAAAVGLALGAFAVVCFFRKITGRS